MKLGESYDIGICSGFEEKCNRVINKSKFIYCKKHREEIIQKKRNDRQEFATGNSSLKEGKPELPRPKQNPTRDISNYATYRIGSETVVAEGHKVKLLSPLKPTVQQAKAKDIQCIINSNIPAAKNIRMLFGFEKEAENVNVDVFGPTLLKKMGGNPFLREELQLTPTKGSPSNRKRTNSDSPSTPSRTPTKLRHAPKVQSDDDLELEILAPSAKKGKTESSDVELEIE
jgi:hypothetical protein